MTARRLFATAFAVTFCLVPAPPAAATVLPAANLTKSVGGTPKTYIITLSNRSTAGEAISTFYFASSGTQSYMSVMPTGITVPSGWSYIITNNGPVDGYGIEFTTSTAPLAADDSLRGFSFQSTLNISDLQTDSTLYAGTPTLSSVAVTGGSVQTPFVASFQTKLVIFGDSLCDVGNSYLIGAHFLSHTISPPNYTLGVFTDGPDTTPSTSLVGNWIQQLSATLQVPPPLASDNGGGDYAYGGAVTGVGGSPPGMGSEVTYFLQDFPTPSANSIYMFYGGGNDLLQAGQSGGASALPAAEATAVSNIQSEIGELANAGARTFYWMNVEPVGDAPVGAQTSYAGALNSASAQFRTDQASAISQLESQYPGITVTAVDLYSHTLQVISNPSSYGLTDVTDSAQGQPVNPDTYLFWDIEHPTTVGEKLIAQLFTQNAPIGDGVSNLIKYLCDINPLVPMASTDRAALPTVSLDSTTTPGTPYLALTYREYMFATGITVNFQESTDLQHWTTVTPDIEQQLGHDAATGDPIIEMGVKESVTGLKEFVRLNVTQP